MKGQRPEESRVEERKHRGAGPDAERQRRNDHRREPRLAAEDTDPVPKVSGHAVEEAADASLAHAFVGTERAAEITPSLGFGGSRTHAPAQVGLDAALEMEAELLVELACQRALAPAIQEAADD